jgi:hypothetical protein
MNIHRLARLTPLGRAVRVQRAAAGAARRTAAHSIYLSVRQPCTSAHRAERPAAGLTLAHRSVNNVPVSYSLGRRLPRCARHECG